MQCQTNELLLWVRRNDSVHAVYCLLHALGQYRTSEMFLWDRPDLCLLNVLSGHQGNTDRCLGGLGVNVCIAFSVLFQRLVKADPVFISLHVRLARTPARGLRVCLGATRSQPATQPSFR